MKCGLCYFEFNEVEGRKSCPACLLSKRCNMIKCPNCGYDMPVESSWAKKIINTMSHLFKKNK